MQAEEILSRLKAAKVTAAARQGWVRVSPHFYISPDDIGCMLEALP
jgi:selenocysteine lyase/cysteine desulfurase